MDQPFGVPEGERPEKDGMHHAEQRGVGADPESEGENGDGGQGRAFYQGAGGGPDVEGEGVHIG